MAKRVTTLNQLVKLANRRKAITCPSWSKPCSAAFLLNMQARVVFQFFQRGIFEYRKETK